MDSQHHRFYMHAAAAAAVAAASSSPTPTANAYNNHQKFSSASHSNGATNNISNHATYATIASPSLSPLLSSSPNLNPNTSTSSSISTMSSASISPTSHHYNNHHHHHHSHQPLDAENVTSSNTANSDLYPSTLAAAAVCHLASLANVYATTNSSSSSSNTPNSYHQQNHQLYYSQHGSSSPMSGSVNFSGNYDAGHLVAQHGHVVSYAPQSHAYHGGQQYGSATGLGNC